MRSKEKGRVMIRDNICYYYGKMNRVALNHLSEKEARKSKPRLR